MKYVIVFLLASLTATESMSQRSRIAWREWTENNIVGVGEDNFILFRPGDDRDPGYRTDELAFGIFSRKYAPCGSVFQESYRDTGRGVCTYSQFHWMRQYGLAARATGRPERASGRMGSRMPLIASTRYTVWHEKMAYLGVRLVHRDKFYYGWIKLAISADGFQAELKEVVFHLDPNQPIITGDRGSVPVGTEVSKTSSIVFFSNTNEGNFGHVETGLTSEATTCTSTRDESRVLSTVRSEGILEQDQELSHSPGSIRACPSTLLGHLNHSTHSSYTIFL